MKDTVYKIFVQADGPMRSGDFVKEHKLDKKGVDRAIKELKNEGKIYSPKRCFYAVQK